MPILWSALTAEETFAINLCSTSETFDYSNIPILPVGGEYIGVTTAVGEIVNTNVDIQFTATGSFDAADIAVTFQLVDSSGGAGVSFSGAQLGWSGQGTFTHVFDTSSLNGLLFHGDQPFSGTLLIFSNLDLRSGPITGNFDRLIYRLDFAACPLGDVTHDMSVNVDDLIAVILQWGDCEEPPEPCHADTNADGVVDADDLITVILNWGEWCPKCS